MNPFADQRPGVSGIDDFLRVEGFRRPKRRSILRTQLVSEPDELFLPQLSPFMAPHRNYHFEEFGTLQSTCSI
jgi:hypothetical protein